MLEVGATFESQVGLARGHLSSLLKRLAKNALETGKEATIDVICNGLEALPIPIVNKMLAQTVRKTFGKDERGRPESVEDAVHQLMQMQEQRPCTQLQSLMMMHHLQ